MVPKYYFCYIVAGNLIRFPEGSWKKSLNESLITSSQNIRVNSVCQNKNNGRVCDTENEKRNTIPKSIESWEKHDSSICTSVFSEVVGVFFFAFYQDYQNCCAWRVREKESNSVWVCAYVCMYVVIAENFKFS